jgi:hypothetical protein
LGSGMTDRWVCQRLGRGRGGDAADFDGNRSDGRLESGRKRRGTFGGGKRPLDVKTADTRGGDRRDADT